MNEYIVGRPKATYIEAPPQSDQTTLMERIAELESSKYRTEMEKELKKAETSYPKAFEHKDIHSTFGDSALTIFKPATAWESGITNFNYSFYGLRLFRAWLSKLLAPYQSAQSITG